MYRLPDLLCRFVCLCTLHKEIRCIYRYTITIWRVSIFPGNIQNINRQIKVQNIYRWMYDDGMDHKPPLCVCTEQCSPPQFFTIDKHGQ